MWFVFAFRCFYYFYFFFIDKKKAVGGAPGGGGGGAASSRNLWVSGMSLATRATDLKHLFSKYGKVSFFVGVARRLALRRRVDLSAALAGSSYVQVARRLYIFQF